MEQLLASLHFTSVGWQIIAPLIFIVADVISGYIQAVINKSVSSSVMRNGLCHKVLLILVLILGFVVEYAFGLSAVSVGICIYIIVMEFTSILENLEEAGVNIDLKSIFEKEESGK